MAAGRLQTEFRGRPDFMCMDGGQPPIDPSRAKAGLSPRYAAGLLLASGVRTDYSMRLLGGIGQSHHRPVDEVTRRTLQSIDIHRPFVFIAHRDKSENQHQPRWPIHNPSADGSPQSTNVVSRPTSALMLCGRTTTEGVDAPLPLLTSPAEIFHSSLIAHPRSSNAPRHPRQMEGVVAVEGDV